MIASRLVPAGDVVIGPVTGDLNTKRYYTTATLLENGKVLVAGGEDSSIEPTASVEVFNPTSGTWQVTESLNRRRAAPTATLLQDGKILVAGGGGASAELGRQPR